MNTVATSTLLRLFGARPHRFRGAVPGLRRSAICVAAALAVTAASCGQASSPELGSRSIGPVQQSDAADDVPSTGSSLSESELIEVQRASAAAAEAARSSSQQRVVQGAAAVDPRAAGTVVAHATAPEVVAFEEPSIDAPVIESFDNPTDRGGPLVFAAIGRPVDGWLQVLLPIRPNGTTGWVQVEGLDLTINPYRIEIDASAYQLTISRYGRQQLVTTVAIGNGDTPTPIGEFFLIELLRPSNPDGAYGPFAYGLSGYSETLETFNGGEGIIGIHGTNQPELLGQDVSHGCIRVAIRPSRR